MNTTLIAPDLKLTAPCLLEFRFSMHNQIKEAFCSSENTELENFLKDLILRSKDSKHTTLDFIERELASTTSFQAELYTLFTGIFNYFYPNQRLNIDTQGMLCRCFGISAQEVRNLISGGACDLLTITNLSKAGGGCGSCIRDIKPLLDKKDTTLDIPEVTYQPYKRELIAKQRPYIFLKEELFPFLEKRNSIRIEGLIGNHLYLEGDENSIDAQEIVDFVNERDNTVNIFFI